MLEPILPSIWELSDHTSLIVHIAIKKEFIQDKKWTIVKNSEEEKTFVNKLRNIVDCIDLTNISNCEILEEITQEFASITEELWYKYSKNVNITKHSKVWWYDKYSRDLTCHMQVHLSGNNVPIVEPPLNHTSPPSIVAIFLTTCLIVVLQPSGYSVLHGGDTPIHSVFHDGITPVSVSTLKPRASPILSVCI